MKRTWTMALGILVFVAIPARAQGPSSSPSAAPVADGLRFFLKYFSDRLIPAADDFPVSKYTYKPTSPQQSVATVVDHLAGSNNFLCASVGGVPVPSDPPIASADAAPPDTLKARLRKSFAFCQTVLASLNDSKLADSVPFFGGKRTRANVILALPYDWGDHYSQMANYLRLNGISPPNARVRAVPVP